MKPRLGLLVCVVCGLAVGPVHAQLYKWTDSKGVVHYDDAPPASHPKAARVLAEAAKGGAPALPYELARAARNHPVTLYTSGECAACDQGRDFLRKRGIPFVEKTVDNVADEARLHDAGGNGQLPFLLIGRNKMTGFEAGAWRTALDAAAYPAKSRLPSSYRFAVQPASPVKVEAAPTTDAAPAERRPAPEQPKKKERSDLPPGFQF